MLRGRVMACREGEEESPPELCNGIEKGGAPAVTDWWGKGGVSGCVKVGEDAAEVVGDERFVILTLRFGCCGPEAVGVPGSFGEGFNVGAPDVGVISLRGVKPKPALLGSWLGGCDFASGGTGDWFSPVFFDLVAN